MAHVMFDALREHGCSVDDALRRFMNNEAMYLKFLSRFSDDPNFGKFEAALAAGDFENIHIAIHTFKGLTGNLGLTKLYELSQSIMAAAKAESYGGERVLALNEELKAEYGTIVLLIERNKM